MTELDPSAIEREAISELAAEVARQWVESGFKTPRKENPYLMGDPNAAIWEAAFTRQVAVMLADDETDGGA